MLLFRRLLVSGAALLLLTSPVVAQQGKSQLRIREVVWGFDGKVRPNSFNPVSILLDNQGEDAFDGTLVLRARQGLQFVGARLVVEAYVQPGGERWVQFTPYIQHESESMDWELRWQGGSVKLPGPKTGREAFVVMVSRSGLSMGTRGLRNFNEDVFPATVAATGSLGSVVLDHVPRWEQPRRQAFNDWLRRGGNLHLLLTDSDTFPKFSDELAMLNNPDEVQSFGAGVVFRHRMTREQIRNDFQKRARAMEDTSRGIPTEGSDEELGQAISRTRTQEYGDGFGGWNASASLHSQLIEMTRPDHAWPLIYLMSAIYILMIFPGCYLLGRKRFHYLVVYGAILGVAATFSLLFLFVGQRGYGERTSVNSVGLALHLDDDHFDVMQWGNAFVTGGNTYEIQHNGTGRVYSSGQVSEPVDGVIGLRETKGEVGTSFVSEIPPFSNRPFVSRQRLKVPDLEAKLTDCKIDTQLRSVLITAGEGFKPDPISRYWLFHRDTVYSAKYTSGTIVIASRLGKLTDVIDSAALRETNFSFMYGNDNLTSSQRYRQMTNHMLAYRFGVQKTSDFDKARLPANRIRLLAYVPMPDALRISGDSFAAQHGYLLVSRDFPIETTP